ncbi:MAG: DUF378 domain-containing protein [Clostridia bacterium]
MITVIAIILTIIGALNWGLIGIFNFNLVTWITMGNVVVSSIIYVLVAIAGLWLIAYLVKTKAKVGITYVCKKDNKIKQL